ncbi:DUF6511 domain-containing protein [Roseibium sp. RKSG952]|uniref:DUF6511 domain-containing protein n=1 Tax=Roseibium sp. RKSG952 TaxID=2529384 RepID=UPI0012BBC4E4|nr:DUF6511 domain-containing protein [Roseibium sp. RKSG952]MTH96369.1 hypothetical protein [Roseibium sp. RKSG952]
MIDLTEQEQAAIREAVKPVAEIMDQIGWQTPLGALSELQVWILVEAAVDGFRCAMAEMARTPHADQEIPF